MPIQALTALAPLVSLGGAAPTAPAPTPGLAADEAVTDLTRGAEWQVEPAPPGRDQRFGTMLTDTMEGLTGRQIEAADAARGLVDGTATDLSSVVMSVERAKLAMQLASQIRTKAVEASQDIFHTQV